MYPFSHITATKFGEYDCHMQKILYAKMNYFSKTELRRLVKAYFIYWISKFIQGFLSEL